MTPRHPLSSLRLTDLRGIGPARERELREAGIADLDDLLLLRPLRWEDRSRQVTVAEMAALPAGVPASLPARVVEARLIRTRRRNFTIVRARVTDGSRELPVIWYNQPYLSRHLFPGRGLWLYGTLRPDRQGTLRLESPEVELASADGPGSAAIHGGRIVPVYRRVGRLSGRELRRMMSELLDRLPRDLEDPLPAALREAQGWPARAEALRLFHFPAAGTSMAELEGYRAAAQKRLVFEELYLLFIALARRRAKRRDGPAAAALPVAAARRRVLEGGLPFALTQAQRSAWTRILEQIARPVPAALLLQGDVGCGKTVVALLAMLAAAENGQQAALMAPTEVLAEQHRVSLAHLLAGRGPRLELLTAGQPAAERRRVADGLADGSVPLVVGTHALIQERVSFARLGLVIVDEQHRFGVGQRLRLSRKGQAPHVMVMTATPIPRSLTLTVYGDLDRVEIRDRPPGRRAVHTLVVPARRNQRVWELLRRAVARGRQAYVVMPLVAESEQLDLAAVEKTGRELEEGPLRGIVVERLHGRMSAAERDVAMSRFVSAEAQVLVATTVIEVGVDVGNAAVLVVLDAERFGLAQLHQLRGRVGRGRHPSICVLVHGDQVGISARRRLDVVRRCDDGFEIARQDLRLRGPGELLGTRQHGALDLRLADLVRDEAVVQEARDEAQRSGRPGDEGVAARAAMRRWGRRLGLLEAG